MNPEDFVATLLTNCTACLSPALRPRLRPRTAAMEALLELMGFNRDLFGEVRRMNKRQVSPPRPLPVEHSLAFAFSCG